MRRGDCGGGERGRDPSAADPKPWYTPLNPPAAANPLGSCVGIWVGRNRHGRGTIPFILGQNMRGGGCSSTCDMQPGMPTATTRNAWHADVARSRLRSNLQARLDGVEREEGHVHRRACASSRQKRRGEGGFLGHDWSSATAARIWRASIHTRAAHSIVKSWAIDAPCPRLASSTCKL